MKTRFSRKLHVAFGLMLGITLALSLYFYDSVQWFEYDVERITIANSALNGYRTLSAQTERKLSLIDESVANGVIRDLPSWHDNVRIMRSAITSIRQVLADEAVLRRVDRETDEMEVLDEMETLVEAIIGSGEIIRTALEDQRPEDARIESVYDANQCQETFKVWAKTDEREYEVDGKVMSLIPLRNRRRSPEGEDLMTRIAEGMTEFKCDGQTGYGLSEYLDQVADGEPVGLKAGH